MDHVEDREVRQLGDERGRDAVERLAQRQGPLHDGRHVGQELERRLCLRDGRQVVALAGDDALKVIRRLEAADTEEAEQMVLAKATGNFKRGNER